MRFLPSVALVLGLSPAPSTQDVPAEGFVLSPSAAPATNTQSAFSTLADASFVVFDGTEVRHHGSDGTLLRVLGTLPGPTFASFLELDASESFACFGESSTGNVYRLPLGATQAPELLANLPFNYDGALSGGFLFVSAATCGFGCGNDVWRIDLATHQAFLVARVPGASGPLAAGPGGELFYASVSDAFPPPPGHAALWRWSRAEAEGSQLLSLAEAELVAEGLQGAARLAHDPKQESVFLAEVDFASGANRILQVTADGSVLPLLEGRPFFAIGSLGFHRPQGPERFRPFQPSSGGVLDYATTDFFATPERFALTPARPVASLSVPAPGQIRIRLEGGPSAGFAVLRIAPRGAVLPNEEPFFVPSLARVRGPRWDSLPIFLGLDPASTNSFAEPLTLNATGGLRLLAPDPGNTAATIAIQLLVYDAQLRIVGSSNVAVL